MISDKDVLKHVPKKTLDKMSKERKAFYVVQNAMGWDALPDDAKEAKDGR